jgi:hypothetical protein
VVHVESTPTLSKLLINPKACVPSAPDIPSSGNREQRENRCSNDQPFHHGQPASLPGNESALELRTMERAEVSARPIDKVHTSRRYRNCRSRARFPIC